MYLSLEKNTLVSSLLPKSLMKNFQTEMTNEKLLETSMRTMALFIVNTTLGAIKAFTQGNYKDLDANPSDGGCQTRAFELRRLTMLDLKEECSALEKAASHIKTLVNKRKGDPKEYQKCLTRVFFQKHLEHITISKEVEYIVHCYLSKALRTPYEKLPNGVVLTKSDVNKLSRLSKEIAILDKVSSKVSRRKIVEENQKTLSMLSVAAMHSAAMQVSSLKSEEKELLITMLSPEHTHMYTPSVEYELKAFGCLFYEVKTILTRLREEQGVICLKSIVAMGEPFYLLLQSKTPAGEFQILTDAECNTLPKRTAIVVFEAVVKVEKEKAAALIMEQGFTSMILTQAAKEAPYEPKSTLDDIKLPEAVVEITAFREKGTKLEDFITLDHVYLNTCGAEPGLIKSQT